MATAPLQRRLVKEARSAATETTDGVQLQPVTDNLQLWEVRGQPARAGRRRHRPVLRLVD